MHLLRQSTAATVLVGPVLDSTGAAVTAAVVGDFKIGKEGSTATLSGATVTHDGNGYYRIALTTGNTDTVGRLTIYSGNTSHSMGVRALMVLLPSVYDALVANATNTTGGLPTATGAISAFAGAISTFNRSSETVTVGTNNDKTGYGLASNGLSLVTAWTVNITGSLSGSVGSVSGNVDGSVGSISGVNFPSNFALLSIDASGRVLLQPTQTGVTIPTVTSVTNGVTLAATTHTGAIIPWNPAWDSEVQSEVQDAIEVNHLDHLFAVTYDPAAKPGVADALLNELVQDNGAGVSQLTTVALALAPTGGGGGGTDWTADERTAIRAILGVPVSGTTPTDPSSGILDTIRDLVIVVDSVADAIEVDTQNIQSRLPTDLVDGRMRSIAEVVGDKTSYKLASDGLSLVTSWAVGIVGNITGNLSGSVGSVVGNVGGNVVGSVGSIAGVTYPANFGALGINTSGHISRVVLVDTTTTNTDMRGTDGAALATHWTATRAGYLDGVLLAANFNNRTVQVTGGGSGHIAADVHSLQPAVINNTHFAAGAVDDNALDSSAVTEIGVGVWVSAGYAAAIRSAVGLAAANLDSQFGSVPASVWASGSAPGAIRSAIGMAAANLDSQLATALVLQRLAASGAAGSVQVTDNNNGTATLVFKDTDGSTTLATVTYNYTSGARTRVS